MNTSNPVRIEQDGAIATISLARDHALNAIDLPTMRALRGAVEEAVALPAARVMILRGDGRSFCSGGDVASMHARRDDLPAFIGEMIDEFHAIVMALNSAALPVVAAVHGAVAGGGISLALACDLVVAARGTRFVTAYAQLGGSADGGLSFRLTQRLGAARALERLTLHQTFDAEEAVALGLVNRVVDAERADDEARRWAESLASLPPASLRELKELTAVQGRAALQAHLAREKEAFLRCAATPEFAERVAAFAARGARRGAVS